MSRATAGSLQRRARLAVLVAATLGLAFFAGTLLAPVLQNAGLAAGGWLRLVYRPACHQMAERSLAVGDATQAVCARCSGLYLGGVVGLVAGGLWLAGTGRRPRPLWLILAVAPTAVDALLPWVGLSGLTNVPRLLLAIPAGTTAALFLAAGIADLAATERRRLPRPPVSDVTPVLEEPDG